jgi:hypothetical protein
MDGRPRLPGFYPETPAATSRYTPNTNSNNIVGSVGGAGGPIRRTPASAVSRARAHSTPYSRPVAQHTPGSGNRVLREDEVTSCERGLISRYGVRRVLVRKLPTWWVR